MNIEPFYTEITKKLTEVTISGVEALTTPALTLLSILAAISILVKWERYLAGQPFFGELIVKIIQVGFVAFLIKNWYKLYIMLFKDSADGIGALAAGAGSSDTGNVAKFLDKYIGKIFDAFSVVWGNNSKDTSLIILLLCSVVLIAAIIMLAYMAYEVFTATYELVIVGGLLVILLPFQVLDYTKEFGNKVYSSLFSMFVKLMVVSFFFYLIGTMADSINMAGIKEGKEMGDSLPSLMTYVVSLGFAMYLMKSSKDIAASIISGATIHSGNPTETAMGMAGAVAGGFAGAAARVGGRVLGRAGRVVFNKNREKAGTIFSR